MMGLISEHMYVVQQLIQRVVDGNFLMGISHIDANANNLVRYLAHYGAETWNRMVVISGSFGRVSELWSNDIALGPVGDQFMVVHELDLLEGVADEEEVGVYKIALAKEMI